MQMEKESRRVLLGKVRLAAEQLAGPSSETVESLLHLVLDPERAHELLLRAPP